MSDYEEWTIRIGDVEYSVEARVDGDFRPPTRHSSAEYPTVEEMRGVPDDVDAERVAEAICRKATQLSRKRRRRH